MMGVNFLLQIIPHLLKGAWVTIQLFSITLLVSMPLGLGVTFLYIGPSKILSRITGFYIMVMRGTPLLLQLVFVYFGLPYVPYIGKYLILKPFTAASIAFIFNYAAYFAEIFRGGLLAVDPGQYEAAKVLGLSRWQTLYRIVLPQMFRVTLPSVSNEALILVKDTALVAIIALTELLRTTMTIVNATSRVSPFIAAAVFYLIMSYVVNLVFKKLEDIFKYE